jgi:hypothetical protein
MPLAGVYLSEEEARMLARDLEEAATTYPKVVEEPEL